MELTPNSRIPFPYLLPSYLLGRSLNIPTSVVLTNASSATTVSRLSTPSRVLQSAHNPMSNSHMRGYSMPPKALSNVGSQFVPPTSQTSRGSYVPILHNISHPPHPTVRPSAHASFGPICPTSQPPTSAWVPLQQPNIGNKYLSGAQCNNPLYVPYPGGITNKWNQSIYEPQA